jgi:hypothetical protein
MIILFRSCEANLGAGSQGDFNSDKPRWNGKYKLEILRKCYLSVQNSLDKTDRTIIINDRTTPKTLKWMEDNSSSNFNVKNITPLPELAENHPYPNYHPVYPNACPDLMEFLIEIAKENQNEIIYICEDDYLHLQHAIPAMKAVFENGYSGFYAPQDYPDRYTLDSSRTCELHLGPYGHLRSIPSATLTIAAKGSTWLKYKYELLRAGAFADDSWTWKAFKQVGCLSPVPGHSTHLQEGCITPVINWNQHYESINIT